MLSLNLFFIILPAIAAEISILSPQEGIYGPGPATARTHPLLSDADECMTPYSDLREAYEACLPGFDQVQIVLYGELYTIHCGRLLGFNRTPQQGSRDLFSCARQCTETAGCKGLQWDTSETCALLVNDLRTEDEPRNVVSLVRGQESLGDRCEQEIEELKSEKADLEVKKEEAEMWLKLYEELTTDIWEQKLSSERLVAQAFEHRDATLNALFQEATLDIWGAKFKMYFGKKFGLGTVADSVSPLKHQCSFTSCLEACARDDDCEAADYDPQTQQCSIVSKWKCLENVIPDTYDGRSISAIRVGRKWELVVASKARKILEAIYRALSSE